MDTIAKHKKRLIGQFVRRQNSAEIIVSAKKMAILMLQSKELHKRHQKKILKEVLWWISEADGKYAARFRSEAVVTLALSAQTSVEKIQHEHVFPRAKVADELLNRRDYFLENPNELESLLDGTVGCVVLASEHKNLDDKAEGWKRYARVPVFDMSTNPPTLVKM